MIRNLSFLSDCQIVFAFKKTDGLRRRDFYEPCCRFWCCLWICSNFSQITIQFGKTIVEQICSRLQMPNYITRSVFFNSFFLLVSLSLGSSIFILIKIRSPLCDFSLLKADIWGRTFLYGTVPDNFVLNLCWLRSGGFKLKWVLEYSSLVFFIHPTLIDCKMIAFVIHQENFF